MKRQPIILIPGCYGSKLTTVSEKHKISERGWFSQRVFPKVQQADASILQLWSTQDSEGTINSVIEQYEDFKTVTTHSNGGLDGCDRFVESKFLDFFDINFYAYMKPICKHLTTNHGYVLGIDLFCLPFDWRTPIYNEKLLQYFRTEFTKIITVTSKRPHIITHSGGALYFNAYCQRFPDFYTQFDKIILINTVNCGAGGHGILAGIHGYDIQVKGVQKIGMKFLETVSGSMIPYLTDYWQRDPQYLASIYVKQYVNNSPEVEGVCFGMLEEKQLVEKFGKSISEIIDVGQLKFDFSYYYKKHQLPSSNILIADQLLQHKPKYLIGMLKLLSPGIQPKCVNLADFHMILGTRFTGKCAGEILERELIVPTETEKEVKNGVEVKQLRFTAFSRTNEELWGVNEAIVRSDNQQKPNQFVEINIVEGQKQLFVKESQYKEFIINGFTELIEITDPKVFEELAVARDLFMHYQQIDQLVEKDCESREIFDLYKDQYIENSPDELFFKFEPQMVKDYIKFQETYPKETFQVAINGSIENKKQNLALVKQVAPIDEKQSTNNPKFYQIASAGLNTPAQYVFEKPVYHLSELQFQKPHVISVDGDSLIPLHSSAHVVYPQYFERGYFIPQGDHFASMWDQRVFQLVDKILYQTQ